MNKRIISFLLSFLFFVSISSAQNKSESINYLKSNLEFLASDELEGREAASRAEKIASLYIANELQKYGIKPFGDEGTYFQNFNLILVSTDETKTSLTLVSKDGGIEKLNMEDDFTLSKTKLPDEFYSGKKYKIVFAGFGVESEEENYSDYKNIDVKGKVVVVLPDTPLQSQKHLRVSNLGKLKQEIAEKYGAVCLLQILGKNSPIPWHLIQLYLNRPSYKIEDELKDSNEEKNIPSIVLSNNSAEKLFAGESIDINKINELTDNSPVNNYFEFEKQIQLNYAFNTEIKPARNVIGILEGIDDKLKKEYVTIGAHYDHLGKKGNEIFNGADDNGSGTVAILEMARRLSAEKKNKRSILFVFHTAEEKGLKGAMYLANNAHHIINNAVVNINIDMVGRESIDTIFSVGSGRLSKELYNLVKEVNSETVNFILDYKFDTPNDPEDIYNRSDHKHYAEKGIPVVFFFDEMTADYHKPTDTIEKINYDKIYKVIELSEALALRIANLEHKLKVDAVDKMEDKN